MDWLPIVSLTVGVVSIIVAVGAIIFSWSTYDRTKSVLAEVDKRAAVIEETVRGTQDKLVDTLTKIAAPPKETAEEKFLATLLPAIASNPDVLKQIMDAAKQQK